MSSEVIPFWYEQPATNQVEPTPVDAAQVIDTIGVEVVENEVNGEVAAPVAPLIPFASTLRRVA